MEQKPTVGRVVHYVSYGTPGGEYGKECRAAVVTAVRNDEPVPEHGVPYVDLCVLNPTGMFFNQTCRYAEWDGTEALAGAEPQGGSWHWPERA
ncbi:hypothetical protein [Streptomyces misionensis]|uniref:hypothetical protein n=1 Tax=Streptomyces misionensis TaxID=67331 RepID=UPI003693552B